MMNDEHIIIYIYREEREKDREIDAEKMSEKITIYLVFSLKYV